MNKYKIYFETEDGLKCIRWRDIEMIHEQRLMEDGLDWYATKIKLFGIFTTYKAPAYITKRAVDNYDETTNEEPIRL